MLSPTFNKVGGSSLRYREDSISMAGCIGVHGAQVSGETG